MKEEYRDKDGAKELNMRQRKARTWTGEHISEAAAYVAPTVMGGSRTATRTAHQTTPSVSTGKRYVGRSGSVQRESQSQRLATASASGKIKSLPNKQSDVRPVKPAQVAARVRVVPWSLRLAAAVALVCLLGLGLRAPALLLQPIDAPLGVEATQAATVNMLVGRVQGGLDPVRVLPLAPAWQGYAPVNPTGGLPLYTWLSAGFTQILGDNPWAGRSVAIIFSILAGVTLFALVRRTAGARAGLYAMLAYSLSPFSIIVGSQFAPYSLLIALQALCMLAVVRWSQSVSQEKPGGSVTLFGLSVAIAIVASLVSPSSIFLLAPIAYIIVCDASDKSTKTAMSRPARAAAGWKDAWEVSNNRGKVVSLGAALAGAALFWWLFASASGSPAPLASGDGGGGVGAVVSAIFSGTTYVQILGALAGKVLTLIGIVLLGAGLLQGARRPGQWAYHVWFLGGLSAVLLDASRLPHHEEVLLPLLFPAFALVGIGAAWAGSLPARVWLALTENKHESDSNYAVSPHTAWLLDLPEERSAMGTSARPQAQMAFGKSVAERARSAGARMRRIGLMGLGHLAVLACLGVIGLSGYGAASAQALPKEDVLTVQAIAQEIDNSTLPDARLVIAGPLAPEIFYASRRTGWALRPEEFNISTLQTLQRNGANYLVSADQEWLGRHPDYVGVLTSYSVKSLTRNFIMFDLATKPAANDRLYFLETGHTLGGEFRTAWDRLGGVAKLGYPLSEEVTEANPLDGQSRKIQYFERAVLEYHAEFAGTPNTVMLADVGRWVTKGRDLPTIAPFQNSANRVYFPQSGHSLKESFLRFWQQQGGVTLFGYPISEELPEINQADGKVYTVQYFERARLEWHPTFAGTSKDVQLGLIGQQALDMPK